MRKWLCGLGIIAVAIISVAYEQHYAREKYQAQSEKDCVALAITPEEKHSCTKETQSHKDYAAWWYVLVAWPDGITTWAIIATGFVIAWQSSETRRSAKASEKATEISERALIAQFRPKVIIRSLRLDPPSYIYYDRRNDGEWRILIQLANIGGTKATLTRGIGYFQEYWGSSPHKELSKWWILEGPIVINPGERETIEYALDAASFRIYMHSLEASTALKGKQPTRGPVFHGAFGYLDQSGIQRETGFGRRWDVVEERFVPLDDPNFEYQD